jgi:hypothetical protein
MLLLYLQVLVLDIQKEAKYSQLPKLFAYMNELFRYFELSSIQSLLFA